LFKVWKGTIYQRDSSIDLSRNFTFGRFKYDSLCPMSIISIETYVEEDGKLTLLKDHALMNSTVTLVNNITQSYKVYSKNSDLKGEWKFKVIALLDNSLKN
jgi:hypothetical protein